MNVTELFYSQINFNSAIDSRWEVVDVLGYGTFGVVLKANDLLREEMVAFKIVRAPGNMSLEKERQIYEILGQNGLTDGFPKLIASGTHQGHAYIVLSLLGESIQRLQILYMGGIPIELLIDIGKQTLTLLERLHSIGYVHRDLKIDNIVRGLPGSGNDTTVYLIDFGQAAPYINFTTGTHITFQFARVPPPQLTYGSIRSHQRYPQSRSDDLESLLYTLVYLHDSKLPWSDILRRNEPGMAAKVLKMKIEIPSEELFENMPKKFIELRAYISNLRFSDTPDYDHMRKLLDEAFDQIHRFRF